MGTRVKAEFAAGDTFDEAYARWKDVEKELVRRALDWTSVAEYGPSATLDAAGERLRDAGAAWRAALDAVEGAPPVRPTR